MTSPQLIQGRSRDRLTAWGLGLASLVFRIWHLQYPKGFVFDEVYYAQNANSLLHHGVELDPKTGAAQFIVHPPVGKWMIAAGIKLFGYHEFGWRISAALVGSASIVMIFYISKRLFNNYFLALSAEILMSADGLHLVMSRTALLDIFLMFFTLLGFFFLLRGQHYAAGLSLGLAAATKWSGVYYLAAYLAFTLYTDYRQNRALEIEHAARQTLREKLFLRIMQYLIIPLAVYVTSWAGWFFNTSGYDRNWANSQHGGFFNFIPRPIRSLWHYHSEMWNFHTTLTESHPYQANPWSWLIMGRPTSFFYQAPQGCGAKACAQEVLALGTPLLWWSGVAAIAMTFGYWISRREWQSGLLLLSLAAGYLPWFNWQKRTVFNFYTIAFEPFVVLIIVFALSKFLEPKVDVEGNSVIPLSRRIASCAYLAVIVINFLYFLPLYLGSLITYSHWSSLMWFPSWI
jgi:dolichyl-phosphate-mannose--protein O-mannosyl transferase